MAIDVYSILRRRYPEKEYALMAEVSDAAGFNRSRSADYIVVNLWPSRGLAINGIELKSFRGDWLSELKNPKKAENIFKYCDHFWLLTTDDTIAKIDEIPINWGWMVIKGEKIFIKKDAPKLEPTTLSKNFVVAMLKRACDKTSFVHINSIEDAIESAKDNEKRNSSSTITQLTKELKEITDNVRDFQNASGISLTHFYRWQTDAKKIGQRVKFIEEGGCEAIQKQLLGLEETAQIVLQNISRGLELLKTDTCKEK